MNKNELEEFRYDVATALLKQMSKGSVWHHAHDRMMQLISNATEQELCDMAPSTVIKQKKPKKKDKSFGFS